MGEKTDGQGSRFHEPVRHLAGYNKEHDLSAQYRHRNTVNHSPMDGNFFDERCETESDQQKHEGSAEHCKVGIDTKIAESCGGQDTSDSGGKVDTFLKGFARIAVDVGQHTGETAQTGSDQTRLRGKAEVIGDSCYGNAGAGTASDVLLEITQCERVPTAEKYGEGYRNSAPDGRAILEKKYPQRSQSPERSQSPQRKQGTPLTYRRSLTAFAGGNNSVAEEGVGIFDQLIDMARGVQADIGEFFEFSASETSESDNRRSAGLRKFCRFNDVR